ncbi:MAG: hypothetical protein RR073_03985 [Clostridia bacterium]
MEDLTDKLQALLTNKDSLEMIKNIAASLTSTTKNGDSKSSQIKDNISNNSQSKFKVSPTSNSENDNLKFSKTLAAEKDIISNNSESNFKNSQIIDNISDDNNSEFSNSQTKDIISGYNNSEFSNSQTKDNILGDNNSEFENSQIKDIISNNTQSETPINLDNIPSFTSSDNDLETPKSPLSQPLNTASSAPSIFGDMGLLGSIDAATLRKIMTAIKSANVSDENQNFLLALRPYLSPKRSEKIDTTLNMMRLSKMAISFFT